LTAPVGSADRLGMPAAPGVREQARHVHTTDTRGRDGRSDEVACEARHVAPQRADYDRRLAYDRSRCIGTQELAPTLTTVTSTAASGRWLTIDRTLDATRARPQRVQAQPESASAQTSANTMEHALFRRCQAGLQALTQEHRTHPFRLSHRRSRPQRLAAPREPVKDTAVAARCARPCRAALTEPRRLRPWAG
jgi:hypothetical protein